MASLTITAEFAVVHVVCLMAITTAGTHRPHYVDGLTVTIVARDLDMRTVETEVRLNVVIEKPDIPVDRVMAAFASAAESSLMRIIIRVAAHTVRFRMFKCFCLVAFSALELQVLAEDRKPGEIVIKANVVGPRHLVVAIYTVSTQNAFMGIVCLVAIDAGCLQLYGKYRLFMAINALERAMGTLEQVVSIYVVIKRRIRPV